MKQHLRYKYFIKDAVSVSPPKLGAYLLFLLIVVIIHNTIEVNMTVAYATYLGTFVFILPHYYLKTKVNTNKKKELLSLIVLFIYFGAAVITDYLLNNPNNIELLQMRFNNDALFLKIATIISVGFVEEYIFRRLLLTQLVLQTRKVRLSILICSVLFTMIHIPRYLMISDNTEWIILNMILIFATSLLLADIYFISKSLILVSLIHAFQNIKPFLFGQSAYNMTYDYFGFIIIVIVPIVYRLFQRMGLISYR